MQRFAIPLYVPPLHGQREIDIPAFLDSWTRVPRNSSRVRFRAIDATLVLQMLFDNDWPANLEGVSRALRHSSRLIFHAECGRHAGRRTEYEIECLRDRWAELGWTAPPSGCHQGRRPGTHAPGGCGGSGAVPPVPLKSSHFPLAAG